MLRRVITSYPNKAYDNNLMEGIGAIEKGWILLNPDVFCDASIFPVGSRL
jgi:hypothetical protein